LLSKKPKLKVDPRVKVRVDPSIKVKVDPMVKVKEEAITLASVVVCTFRYKTSFPAPLEFNTRTARDAELEVAPTIRNHQPQPAARGSGRGRGEQASWRCGREI